MKKNDLFRIASMLVMILLLPLALSLTYMILAYMIHGRLYLSLEPSIGAIIHGIFISLIIAYGYITKDKIASTLSGIFLIPLSLAYADFLSDFPDPYFVTRWLKLITSGEVIFNPLMLFGGLAGYFASRGTKVSLLVAILFGILFSLFVLGID
ncbi:MAG TPA: hypothetical protein C5S37_06160 [Methanophagales archaeon]|nr:hypothetical protein [Methanophagales archaeon]